MVKTVFEVIQRCNFENIDNIENFITFLIFSTFSNPEPRNCSQVLRSARLQQYSCNNNLYRVRIYFTIKCTRNCSSQTHPKLQSLLSQERGSYGLQIWPVHSQVHPNKSPLKIWEKGNVGVMIHCLFFRIPPIISITGIAANFKFCTHIRRIDRNKSL